MACIVIGTDIILCNASGNDPASEGGLHQRVHSSMLFQHDLERDSSEYVRLLSDDVGLFQSEYFVEATNNTLVLLQVAAFSKAFPISIVDTMTLLGIASVSGGRVESGGGGSTTVSAIFDSLTQEGMVVYVSSSGHVDLAKADVEATSLAVGLANEPVAATSTGDYITDNQITRSDWTVITGTTNLVAGATYYLSAASAGQMTTTPPSAEGDTVVRIGTALTTTTIDIEIAQPVLL